MAFEFPLVLFSKGEGVFTLSGTALSGASPSRPKSRTAPAASQVIAAAASVVPVPAARMEVRVPQLRLLRLGRAPPTVAADVSVFEVVDEEVGGAHQGQQDVAESDGKLYL